MKKRRALSMVMGWMLLTSGWVSADVIDMVKPEPDSGSVYIKGSLPKAQPDQIVTVTLLKSGKTAEDCDTEDVDALKNALAYMGQARTDENGAYQISVPGAGNSGQCLVRVSYRGGEVFSANSYYTTVQDAQGIQNILNNGTQAAVADLVETQGESVGMNPSVIRSLGKEAIAEKILEERESGTFGSISEVVNIVNGLEIIARINQLSSADSAKFAEIIEQNPQIFQIYAAYPYFKQMQGKDAEFALSKCLGTDYKNALELEQSFNEKMMLTRLKSAVNYREVSGILSELESVTGIALAGYHRLKDTAKVDQAICGNWFDTIEELEKAISNASSNQNTSTIISGGGGGGGGGTVSSRFSTPIAVPSPESTQVQDNQKSGFADLNEVEWAKEAILYLAEKNIVSGDGNGYFLPDQQITREEFVKLMVLACGLYDGNATVDFADVREDAWYYPYIASANKAKLIEGIGDGRFGVGDSITRQDLVTITYRTLTQLGKAVKGNSEISFADENEIAAYAKEAVSALCDAEIISGMGDNRFAPKENATRAQACKIVYAFLTRKW